MIDLLYYLQYEKLCGVVIILLRHCENYLTRIKRLFTRDTCQQGIGETYERCDDQSVLWKIQHLFQCVYIQHKNHVKY